MVPDAELPSQDLLAALITREDVWMQRFKWKLQENGDLI